MGGRGSRVGTSVASSNKIRERMLKKALGSKFAGVRRDAKAGTGNYGFKNAKAVNPNTAKKMTSLKEHKKGDDVLIEGFVNNKHVFYAAKEGDKTISSLRGKMAASKSKRLEESKINRPEINTTSTYDRWQKNNRKNFDAWFGKR